MGCDIIFSIGGKEIRVDNTTLSASDNSLEKIAKVLLENQRQHIEVLEAIKLSKLNLVVSITSEDIAKEGLMGNTSLDKVIGEFSGVTWPENVDDYKLNILLVKGLKYNGKSTSGRVIDKYGNELFILLDSIPSIQRFANYLKVRDLIELYPEEDEELDIVLKKLRGLWKEEAPKNIKDMLIDFQNNEERYRDIMDKDIDIYGTLNDTLRGLCGYTLKNIYSDKFVNAINSRLNRRSDLAKISKDTFYKYFAANHPEAIEELKKNGLNKQMILSDELILTTLIGDYFINAESELNYEVSAITDKNIVFKSVPKTLENRYGFTYNTINNLVSPVEDYRGYHIYSYNDNGVTKYLYDRNVLTVHSWSKLVPSIEEVKKNIDRRISLNDTLASQSYIEFKMTEQSGKVNNFLRISKAVNEGVLVDSLDVPLKKGTSILSDEAALLEGKLLEFYNYFEDKVPNNLFQRMQQVLDTNEKAGIFIYKMNEILYWNRPYDEAQFTSMNEILDIIEGAGHKYFLVEKKFGPIKEKDENVYYVKVIPTNLRVELDEHFNRPIPVIGLINDVVGTFNKKFGVGAEVLTADEILELFSDVDADAKAFIRDGKIYINGSIASSSDAIHEYTHLFLGVLKARNFEVYQKLLDSIISNNKKAADRKQRKKRRYPNLSDSDLNEEVFADLFAEHLSGKDVNSIFTEATLKLNSDLEGTIFNLANPEDFNTIYMGNMYSMFNKFSSDIGKVGNGLDFSVGTVYRQAANWIADKIGKKEIIERC